MMECVWKKVWWHFGFSQGKRRDSSELNIHLFVSHSCAGLLLACLRLCCVDLDRGQSRAALAVEASSSATGQESSAGVNRSSKPASQLKATRKNKGKDSA